MATLRIITANLLNGRASPSVLRRLIQAERPHILGVQELAPNAARVIETEFPFGKLSPRDDYHGNGLALRHEATVEQFDLEHRNGLRAILTPDSWPELSHPLEVVTVHFASPAVRPIRRSIEARRRQTAQVLAHVREHPRARIFIGDFNATPLWPPYRAIAGVMTDAPRALGTAQRTWAPLWWMPRLLRIDHVFAQGMVPIKARTRRIRRSDHSALIVDFETT